MVCGKVEMIINAMVKSCLSVQEIADKAGVSVNVVYRVRLYGQDGAFWKGMQGTRHRPGRCA